jgi:hypothetical protein
MNRNRLRNIEATEKAKREMLEARNSKPKPTERDRKHNESEESYAAARCTSLPLFGSMMKAGADIQSLVKKERSLQMDMQLKKLKGKLLVFCLLVRKRRKNMNRDMNLLRMNRFMIGSRKGQSFVLL